MFANGNSINPSPSHIIPTLVITHYSMVGGVQSSKVMFNGVNRYTFPSLTAIWLRSLTCRCSNSEIAMNCTCAELGALIFWAKYSLLLVRIQTPGTSSTVPAASCCIVSIYSGRAGQLEKLLLKYVHL